MKASLLAISISSVLAAPVFASALQIDVELANQQTLQLIDGQMNAIDASVQYKLNEQYANATPGTTATVDDVTYEKQSNGTWAAVGAASAALVAGLLSNSSSSSSSDDGNTIPELPVTTSMDSIGTWKVADNDSGYLVLIAGQEVHVDASNVTLNNDGTATIVVNDRQLTLGVNGDELYRVDQVTRPEMNEPTFPGEPIEPGIPAATPGTGEMDYVAEFVGVDGMDYLFEVDGETVRVPQHEISITDSIVYYDGKMYGFDGKSFYLVSGDRPITPPGTDTPIKPIIPGEPIEPGIPAATPGTGEMDYVAEFVGVDGMDYLFEVDGETVRVPQHEISITDSIVYYDGKMYGFDGKSFYLVSGDRPITPPGTDTPIKPIIPGEPIEPGIPAATPGTGEMDYVAEFVGVDGMDYLFEVDGETVRVPQHEISITDSIVYYDGKMYGFDGKSFYLVSGDRPITPPGTDTPIKPIIPGEPIEPGIPAATPGTGEMDYVAEFVGVDGMDYLFEVDGETVRVPQHEISITDSIVYYDGKMYGFDGKSFYLVSGDRPITPPGTDTPIKPIIPGEPIEPGIPVATPGTGEMDYVAEFVGVDGMDYLFEVDGETVRVPQHEISITDSIVYYDGKMYGFDGKSFYLVSGDRPITPPGTDTPIKPIIPGEPIEPGIPAATPGTGEMDYVAEFVGVDGMDYLFEVDGETVRVPQHEISITDSIVYYDGKMYGFDGKSFYLVSGDRPITPPTDELPLEPTPPGHGHHTVSVDINDGYVEITVNGKSQTTDYTAEADDRGVVHIKDRHGNIVGKGSIDEVNGTVTFGNGIVVNDRGDVTLPPAVKNNVKDKVQSIDPAKLQKAKSAIQQRLRG